MSLFLLQHVPCLGKQLRNWNAFVTFLSLMILIIYICRSNNRIISRFVYVYTLLCSKLYLCSVFTFFHTYTLQFQEYIGNKDQNTLIINDLIQPIKAQYVRILPQEWHGHISMRMELYGCDSSKYLLCSLYDDKHFLARMAKVCSTASANSSKVPSSRQILSMRWILHL